MFKKIKKTFTKQKNIDKIPKATNPHSLNKTFSFIDLTSFLIQETSEFKDSKPPQTK